LAILKPTILQSQPQLQVILKLIKSEGFEIFRMSRLFWTIEEAEEFYSEHRGRTYYKRLCCHASSGPFIALGLSKVDAVKDWRSLIGPTHFYKDQWNHPNCLRARFGTSDTRNGFHGSDGPESAQRELSFCFEGFDLQWHLNRLNLNVTQEHAIK